MRNLKGIISNATTAAKQKKNLIIVGSLSMIILILTMSYVTGSKETKKTDLKKETTLVTALDSIDPSDVWLYKSESRLDDQDEAIDELQKEIDRIQRSPTNNENQSQANEALEARLLELEEMLATMKEETDGRSSSVKGAALMPARGEQYQSEGFEPYESQILSLNMGLKPKDVAKAPALTVENFIPVGSFAKAVLLTGVDAPAAVSSAENPVPMLLRVVDNAILPRGMRGDIDTCHVTASAYGEISEERVRVRLDKISCTYLDGRVFVENIDGYVTGEDGKNGVRGTVIWRDGALLTRSFAAGFLGGVSDGIADAAGTTSTSALGTVQSYDGAALFQQGIGAGAGSALNKLSEYYIKRAEQYHPVIEVEAGRMVDIVISSKKDSKNNGLKLGDSKWTTFE